MINNILKTCLLFNGLVIACLLNGCSKMVFIPTDPKLDSPPVITLNATALENNGRIEKGNVTEPTTVNVELGSKVMFIASAKNPGGVKSFEIEIFQNGVSVYKVSQANPNNGGKAADLIAIVGTNGSGLAGNIPLIVDKIESPVTIVVSSSNFNTQINTFSVEYFPVDYANKDQGRQETSTITLSKIPGQNLLVGTFPESGMNAGNITLKNAEIRGSTFPTQPAAFLKSGYGVSDCRYPIALANGFSVREIFGIDNPPTPMTFRVCSSENRLTVTLYYSYN